MTSTPAMSVCNYVTMLLVMNSLKVEDINLIILLHSWSGKPSCSFTQSYKQNYSNTDL